MGSSRRRPRLRNRALVLALVFSAAACATHPRRVASPDVAAPNERASAARDIAAFFSTPAARRVLWGALIQSLERPGEVLCSINPDQLFVPASNAKLLTVAAAADRLGWAFTFETTVRATTAVDRDGSIRGDLVVRGTGDPTAGDRPKLSPAVIAIADALWQQGVRLIEGRIIGDDDGFADEPYGAGWAWDDLSFSYSAPVGALNYNENLRAAAQSAAASESPRYSSVDNPTLAFADALRSAIVARGITVGGGAADIDVSPPGPLPPNLPILASYRSSPLSDIAIRLLKASQNLYAEVFLRAIGESNGQAGSSKAGLDAIRATLATWGIDPGAVAQADGSGLSRYNLVTPDALTKVLEHMYRDARLREAWFAAMPVAGVDGTLEKRMKGTAAEGRVFAKTGSLSSVRALSGYIQARSGEWFVFSILANNFASPTTAADVDGVIDQVVARVAAMSSTPN
jgi:D-alanyl-D-alanine carboxypeptidase/D-alanyl-D-alanine-endopeptidase (penicillin-binding protein 4)